MRWPALLVAGMVGAAGAQEAPKKKKPEAKKVQQAHKKPTPEQVRKFNELEKKQKQ